MEAWVNEAFTNLNELYNKCGNEDALKEYVVCMKRLLNGAVQMTYSQLLVYEKKLLWKPLEVFCKQFVEQVNVALKEKNTYSKRRIVKDIESSLCEMFNLYKGVIDGTNNSDHQSFLNKSINTNMYELSPKICVFYSDILERVVEMFDPGGRNYAFALHPTVRNNTEACQLFREKQKSGKVVLIYIPEYVIEQFNVMPVHLLHEAFHVITRNERKRKLRAKCYMQHMLIGIEQLLFRQISIGEKNLDEKLKTQLLDYWLGDIGTVIEDILEADEGNALYYSENLTTYFLKKLRQILIEADGKIVDGIETYYCCYANVEYQEYIQRRTYANQIAGVIRKNLFDILCNDRLNKLSNMFMRIYREAYADIGCLLVLEIEPEIYVETFKNAVKFDVKDDYYDYEKDVRSLLVAKAVSTKIRGDKKSVLQNENLWYNYQNELSTNLINGTIVNQQYITMENVLFTQQILDIFMVYFEQCAEAISNTLEKIPELEDFRKKILNSIQSNQTDFLASIMCGEME